MLQNKVPKNCFFPIPAWSPGFPGRLPDPKAPENGTPDMDFLLFEDLAFTFFGDTLEICRVFHE